METRPIPDCLTVTELPNDEFKQYWEDLVGAEGIKKRLLIHMQACLSPQFLSWRQQHNNCRRIPRFRSRVLLVGPSGTGKTLIAKGSADCYARVHGEKVYFAELGSVRGKYVGESSKNVERACDYVEYLSKDAIVEFFTDEFDSVGVSRNTEQMHDDVRAMVNTLIRRMNRMNSSRIFMIAASNLEKHVDHATKRRFDFVLYFKRPTLDQRLQLFEHLTGGWNLSAHELLTLSRKTQRYTQDDITRSVNFAEEEAFSENKPLTITHLMRATSQIKPTEEYG